MAHGKKLQGFNLPVALIGDYNIMPSDLDIYKPEKYKDNALFGPESRKLWRELIKSGWTDAIRKLHPNEPIYTFWDYLRNAYGRNAGLRLDHFLLNELLVGRLKAIGVDKDVRGREHSSDHAPVWMELKEE
ncbi:exodeoxyribonuclease III [Mucilaginibacter sp. SP1R1]|uniref:exodeoxyribonuclease III n=1 Tax=Mucilaginibacter sp. SP1R1 TaxID=2723091 RepID=UPI003B002EB2